LRRFAILDVPFQLGRMNPQIANLTPAKIAFSCRHSDLLLVFRRTRRLTFFQVRSKNPWRKQYDLALRTTKSNTASKEAIYLGKKSHFEPLYAADQF
jgi:hypothetical protein